MCWKILTCVCLLVTLGCGSSPSQGFDEPDSGADRGDAQQQADAGTQADAEPQGQVDAGEVVCWTTSPDELLTDADNCGVCGHSCLGGACNGGFCEASLIATEDREIGAFASSALYSVYVMDGPAGWNLYSRLNNGTARQQLTGDITGNEPPDHLQVVGDSVYYAVNRTGTISDIDRRALDGSSEGHDVTSAGQVTGATSLDGTTLYWFFEDGTLRKTTVGSGTESIVSFTHGNAVSAKTDGTYIFYWDGAGLIKTPTSPVDPLSPGNVTLTGVSTPFDWAVADGRVYWHSGDSVRSVSTSGGSVTIFADGTGSVEAGLGVVYISDFDGTNDVIRAYAPGGTHLADVALFTQRAVDAECSIREVPLRIMLVGNFLYVSTREDDGCGLEAVWNLYRLPRL